MSFSFQCISWSSDIQYSYIVVLIPVSTFYYIECLCFLSISYYAKSLHLLGSLMQYITTARYNGFPSRFIYRYPSHAGCHTCLHLMSTIIGIRQVNRPFNEAHLANQYTTPVRPISYPGRARFAIGFPESLYLFLYRQGSLS